MSEEVQATEGVAAAEASVATPAPVDTTVTSPSPTTEAPAASSPSPEPVAEAAPAAPEEPVEPEFDLDSWNGEIDTLPELHRSVGTRINDMWNKRYTTKEEEMAELHRLNDALLLGGDDPRLKEYQDKFTASEGKYAELETQFKEYQAHIQASVEQDAKDYASRFKEKHQEIFDDKEKSAQLAGLIEADWDPEVAVKLLSYGEKAMEIAANAKRDGVPDSYAMRLVEAAIAPKRQAETKVRPGAKITSGATASSLPNQSVMSLEDAPSLDDKRTIAARRALRVASGRR
tara:strand:- start:1255 stop:2118 length:864 start_codon:yes stop_codon:yes gene_type:complete